jgi:hypothetical protein
MTQSTRIARREEWRRRVDEFRASGRSVAAWCVDQGIKPHQMYYWLKRFPAMDEVVVGHIEMQWLPVHVSDDCSRPAVGNGGLLVRVGDAVVEVTSGFNPRLFADVVRTLIELC